MSIKIGFTERGDAGRDLSWYDKCLAGKCDGAIVITKLLTPECREKLLNLYKAGFPVILHCGCTGWGGTYMEPNVPGLHVQLHSLKELLRDGFPLRNVVLRVDPIIPTDEGLMRAQSVLNSALSIGILPSGCRVRISVVDMYRHVNTRFEMAKITSPYGDAFAPSQNCLKYVRSALGVFHYRDGIVFETCAEPALYNLNTEMFVQRGCISKTDLDIMGLSYDKESTNPQGRSGCLCLGCKVELLENKHRCPNGCLYCYWRDKN